MNTATMRSRVTGFFVKIIIAALLLLTVLYFLAAFEYRARFPYGTRINGVYCAGLEVQEVSSILDSTAELSPIRLFFPGERVYEIEPSAVKLKFNYEYELTRLNYGRNPFLWGKNLFSKASEQTISPSITCDREMLRSAVYELSVFKEFDEDKESIVDIVKVDGAYTLIDTTGPVISKESVYDYICAELDRSNLEITIPDSFVKEYSYSPSEQSVLDQWKSVENFVTPKIIYDMGDEKIEVDAAFLSSILVKENGSFKKEPDGSLAFDEEAVIGFADEICDRYETADKPRTFTDYNGEVKTLERNYFGTLIDKKAEEEYLLNAIRSGLKETHIPKYLHETYHRGLDDIGPDRIEIDLTRQKLYYIKGGKLFLETDVVTGNPNTLHATNEMATTIRKKSTNTYLRGEGYRSFVKYWMAVYQNVIGIHDASWQKAFGGNRYLTHGSKGCINVPEEAAKTLYDEVELDMPVLIYK